MGTMETNKSEHSIETFSFLVVNMVVVVVVVVVAVAAVVVVVVVVAVVVVLVLVLALVLVHVPEYWEEVPSKSAWKVTQGPSSRVVWMFSTLEMPNCRTRVTFTSGVTA